MTTSKGINPVPDFKDKHFMLYETFKKQELLSPLKKDFKRNLTFSSFFEKKKNKKKSRFRVLVFISKTLVIKEISESSFSRGFSFAVHNRLNGGRLDSSLNVKRPPVPEKTADIWRRYHWFPLQIAMLPLNSLPNLAGKPVVASPSVSAVFSGYLCTIVGQERVTPKNEPVRTLGTSAAEATYTTDKHIYKRVAG